MKLWHLKVGGQIHCSLSDPLQRSFSEPEQIQNHNPCLLCVSGSGLDPSQRQGVEELISAAPSRFDHAALFTVLQRSTLQHRMSDSFSCLVRHMNAAVILRSASVSQTGATRLTVLVEVVFLLFMRAAHFFCLSSLKLHHIPLFYSK